jgi:hypothetical protein
MTNALFFKEWIKSRWVLLLTAVAFAGVVAYTFMGIAQELRLLGAGAVWENIVQKGVTYFSYVKFLPLMAGVLLALAQYVPEMSSKRLKLTLHLPLPEGAIMLTMLAFGLVVLAALFGAFLLAIFAGLQAYFPYEITRWNLAELHPWWWGGVAAYLLTAWVCLEPTWRQRILNGVIAALVLSLFYFKAPSGAYAPLLPYLAALVVVSLSFSFLSLIRFKEGRQ